ncbi:NfeD family protein [Thiocapsa rosea]|uniref:Membrane-bound serine protease (ClpP class) n=1 Tax=Thiocapsa rosea TaxID=69360 RepID=A0A495VB73_9GAMM|nr:nodulation protein NfeD [Thiocapsa rosea]RKT46010.1 membrane-bound serine protease (ClpP class) [Thiocapsa rosea]
MPNRIGRWLAMLIMGLMVTNPAGVLAREALLIDLQGAIGPAGAAYVEDAVAVAEDRGAGLIILRMDTPGGLDTSMRSIVKSITASRVPVVGYVAPTGARAASAGTYILYACPVAAMAPGTNLGAATPVQLGGLPSTEPKPGPADTAPREEPSVDDPDAVTRESAEDPKTGQETLKPAPRKDAPMDASSRKAVQDAAAYLRSLAELHGRNADWAERSVREGASLSAEAALELGVIDQIAADLDELLHALDGRQVRIGDRQIRLDTSDMSVVERAPNWKTRLLGIISDPNLAYILLLVGIYGLVYEFANPGAVFPGTVGAVSLLLALYAFQLLPINYTGAALILLGLALMIAEAFVPSFGALGVGGAVAFVIGSLILIDTEVPGFGISIPLIIGFALSSALLFFVVIGMALKAHRQPVASGSEELAGALGEAVSGFPGPGSIHLHGEIWTAESDRDITPGTPVRVIARHGLTLLVEPISMPESGSK